MGETPAPVEASGSAFAALTPREREIARAIALGVARAAIATRLGISSKTVEMHRANALEKLAVANNVQLARKAVRDGFVPLDNDTWEPAA